ncbi:MAG: hypothetical protein QOE11_2605 [Solirubrobacteraceae bacterium]|jgi:hypothetical protein|nr:hypothetical protein [Solirubrobacteraceae bacterium]
MTRLLSALVALLLLALPAAAMAAPGSQTNAPPGNSAIDEYLETVPGATGNQRPRPPAAAGTAPRLTAAQRARLERLGPDGRAVAAVVESTAPAHATLKPGTAVPSATGRSPLGEVLGAAAGQGGGGMGALLPAILLASLLGVITLVVLRRRSVS